MYRTWDCGSKGRVTYVPNVTCTVHNTGTYIHACVCVMHDQAAKIKVNKARTLHTTHNYRIQFAPRLLLRERCVLHSKRSVSHSWTLCGAQQPTLQSFLTSKLSFTVISTFTFMIQPRSLLASKETKTTS